MMLAAQGSGEAARACDLAALLEGRDPLRGGLETPADVMLRLEALDHPSAAGADRNAVQWHSPGGAAISFAAGHRRQIARAQAIRRR